MRRLCYGGTLVNAARIVMWPFRGRCVWCFSRRLCVVPGHVFISYAHSDDAYVRTLAAYLQDEGLPVWFDYRIQTGEEFDRRIEQAIKNSAAMIVVLSPDAMTSTWVRREISYAEEYGIDRLPLLLIT